MHTKNEILNMSQEELHKVLTELRRTLSDLRVRNGLNQLKETDKIGKTRLEIARILTQIRRLKK